MRNVLLLPTGFPTPTAKRCSSRWIARPHRRPEEPNWPSVGIGRIENAAISVIAVTSSFAVVDRRKLAEKREGKSKRGKSATPVAIYTLSKGADGRWHSPNNFIQLPDQALGRGEFVFPTYLPAAMPLVLRLVAREPRRAIESIPLIISNSLNLLAK